MAFASYVVANSAYRVLDVDGSGDTMQDVMDQNDGLTFVPGHGFYQVGRKKETVGSNKEIVLVKSKEAIDDPAEVRKILKMKGKSSQINENSAPGYQIFVQSTSSNRKLKEGTKMLFKVDKSEVPAGGGGGSGSADSDKKTTKKTKTESKSNSKSKRKKKGSDDEGGEEDEEENEADEEVPKKFVPAENDPKWSPMMRDFFTRIRQMILKQFPGCNRKITEFIIEVSSNPVTELFAKHESGKCKCTDASCVLGAGRTLKDAEWFGSDFFYEDNWSFPGHPLLQGFEGVERFPEYFPFDDAEDGEVNRKEEYSIDLLCEELNKCVIKTLEQHASGGVSATPTAPTPSPPPAADPATPSLPACPFGEKCYRKGKQHLSEFTHPPKEKKTRKGKAKKEEEEEEAEEKVVKKEEKKQELTASGRPKRAAAAKKRKIVEDDDEEDEEEEEDDRSSKKKHKNAKGKTTKDEDEEEEETGKKKNGVAAGKGGGGEYDKEEEEVKKPSPAAGGSSVPAGPRADYGSFPFGLKWKQNRDDAFWYLTSGKLSGSNKIIGFDMDWTLINPKSGGTFPANRKDWKWWGPNVKKVLRAKFDEGYNLVIFSNQAGIEKNKQDPDDIAGKILDMIEQLDFPMQAFFAGATNHVRKPNTTMWDFMVENHNGGVLPDLSQCMYVGDAAGRAKGWKDGASRDIGDGDRCMAYNLGVAFMTPEEFFDNEPPAKFKWTGLDPRKYLKDLESGDVKEFEGSSIAKDTTEMVLFVGMPASGKSTFAERHLIPKGYEWVNRDTLKTQAKCQKAAREALEDGRSVAIDNTSPDVEGRSAYISIAQDLGIPVRCFVFETSRELATHLNFFREKVTQGARRRVPPVGYNMYLKKFTPPKVKEGFSEVCTVRFKPHFTNPVHRKWFLERTVAE